MKKYNVTVNGTVYEVTVEELTADTAAVAPEKKPVPAAAPAQTPKKSEKPAPAPAAASGPEGNIKMVSPMPGTILKINVSVGQQIKKGEILCLLEAMKMENEIVAPADATVASVNTSQGNTVQTGELLFTLN